MHDQKSNALWLEKINIPLWVERAPFLFLDKPLAFAELAILLAKPLNREDPEEKKVLSGMISVLALKKTEYWLGWLFGKSSVSENYPSDFYLGILQRFKPKAILLLGEPFAVNSGLSHPIHATFHPRELIKTPENKKKAYQSLLNLRKTL